jgi:uncharacterized protein with von Willebrand factor type A (vWA) domain
MPDGGSPGASFVRTGETGALVDLLPPGRQCVETDQDERTLAIFMDSIEQAHSLDRRSVRDGAAEEFDTDRIVDHVIEALRKCDVSTKPESCSSASAK